MMNTLSRIAVLLSSLVIVAYCWNPIFNDATFTSRDLAIIFVNLLSLLLNGLAVKES